MADETLRSGHAPVNGLQRYSEIHGAGEPLVLLHGGLGMTGMFGALPPRLAQGRQKMPVSRLAILPGTTHYDIFASPLLAAVVTPFLAVPMQPVTSGSLAVGDAIRGEPEGLRPSEENLIHPMAGVTTSDPLVQGRQNERR